jgi:hypothetical protein
MCRFQKVCSRRRHRTHKGSGIQTLADTEVLEMYHNVLLEDVFSQYMAHAPFVREFFSAYTKKT